MNNVRENSWKVVTISLVVLLVAVTIGWSDSDSESSDFARTTIDVGIVVSDIEKSVAFYKDALGFTELDGFDVPASMATDSGLTDNQPFHVHVLVLGEGETATKIKLMQFPNAPGKPVDHSYIHSSLGMSYLTIFVNDTTAAVARAKQHGAEPLAKGPVALPEGFPQGIYLTLVKDPDGNMIELVGPKK